MKLVPSLDIQVVWFFVPGDISPLAVLNPVKRAKEWASSPHARSDPSSFTTSDCYKQCSGGTRKHVSDERRKGGPIAAIGAIGGRRGP